MEDRFGSYRIDAILGTGPHGAVYQATDTTRRRIVALKLLKPDLFADPQDIQRFTMRLEFARELVHPGVAWIWEIDRANEYIFITSRFIDGPSLRDRLRRDGPLGWGAALDIVRQAASVLQMIHSRGYVHGNLHAANLLLSPEHGVVLSDIGLSQALSEVGRGPAMPVPTQAEDAFGLALVLVEALSGKPVAQDPAEYLHILRQGTAPRIPDTWPVLTPRRLNTVLQRALAEQPARRYVGLKDFLDALDAAANHPKAWPSKEEIAVLQAAQQAEKDAQEQERQAVEELARQAALKQARLEIDAQIQRAKQERDRELEAVKATLAVEPPTPPPAVPAIMPDAQVGKPAQPPKSTQPEQQRLLRNASLLVTILAVVSALLWSIPRLLPGGALLTPTLSTSAPVVEQTGTSPVIPTETPLKVTPSNSPAPATPTMTASYTPTASLTPSPTATFTATYTTTGTATRYSSPTATWPTPKPSRTPRKGG